jgi:hypothetical protein
MVAAVVIALIRSVAEADRARSDPFSGWEPTEAKGLHRHLDPETGTVCYRTGQGDVGALACVRYRPMPIPQEAILPDLGKARVTFARGP